MLGSDYGTVSDNLLLSDQDDHRVDIIVHCPKVVAAIADFSLGSVVPCSVEGAIVVLCSVEGITVDC